MPIVGGRGAGVENGSVIIFLCFRCRGKRHGSLLNLAAARGHVFAGMSWLPWAGAAPEDGCRHSRGRMPQRFRKAVAKWDRLPTSPKGTGQPKAGPRKGMRDAHKSIREPGMAFIHKGGSQVHGVWALACATQIAPAAARGTRYLSG